MMGVRKDRDSHDSSPFLALLVGGIIFACLEYCASSLMHHSLMLKCPSSLSTASIVLPWERQTTCCWFVPCLPQLPNYIPETQRCFHFFPAEDSVAEKLLAYNRANRAVAILCNHQRSTPKTHEKSMQILQTKVRLTKQQPQT